MKTKINIKIEIEGDLTLYKVNENGIITQQLFKTHEQVVKDMKDYFEGSLTEMFANGEMDENMDVDLEFSLFEGKENVKINVS